MEILASLIKERYFQNLYGSIDVLVVYDHSVLFHVRLSKHDSLHMKHIMHTCTKHKDSAIRLCMKNLLWEKITYHAQFLHHDMVI